MFILPLTSCKGMAGIQANTNPRFVLHTINDTLQFFKLASYSVTLATHVLNNCAVKEVQIFITTAWYICAEFNTAGCSL